METPETQVEPQKEAQQEEEEEDEDERGTWGNQFEFFLSCLGYAVGFGNVWRFPYLCYKNGGAAFLIPYVIMLFVAGLPLFFMELVLGQYASLGPNIVFPHIAPLFSGLGWAMVVVSALVAIYYNVILAWSLFYTFASFTKVLPWGSCSNDFNSKHCYILEEEQACQEASNVTDKPYYYNDTCVDAALLCEEGGVNPYNETHCEGPDGFLPAESAVPRISPSEDYFQNYVLGVTGTTWEDMGGMRWELVGCLALAWVIVGLCMIKGVKSSGKVVYFTALFPYAVLIILFGRGVTLEGARVGIDFYFLKPDWSRLQDVAVWNDAASQIFYSLGSSFGGLITLASYNRFRNNCMRDAIVIAICNCATSVFAGFVIFSILGFLATELGVEVADVASSGSGLAFVVYPAAVARMPVAPLWSVLFFLMLVTLGLDSQFTMVETVMTALFDQFEGMRRYKPWVVAGCCLLLFAAGLTMCLEGGVYMFELFFYYSSSTSVIILALLEVVLVQYIYGFKKFMTHIRGSGDNMGIWMPAPLRYYWLSTWVVLTPASLLLILVMSFVFFVPAAWGDYVFPQNIQLLGWYMVVASVALVPLGMAYGLGVTKTEGRGLLQASEDFCPAHVRRRRANDATAMEIGTIKQISEL